MPGKIRGLYHWCLKVTDGYHGVNVVDMTSSWKNGLAFCAMIHRFRPDLIDFDSLSAENVYENNSLAFSIAEKEFGIQSFLDARDMAEMACPDRMSVVTYLAQYYDYFKDEVLEPCENVNLHIADDTAIVTNDKTANDSRNKEHGASDKLSDPMLSARNNNGSNSVDSIENMNTSNTETDTTNIENTDNQAPIVAQDIKSNVESPAQDQCIGNFETCSETPSIDNIDSELKLEQTEGSIVCDKERDNIDDIYNSNADILKTIGSQKENRMPGCTQERHLQLCDEHCNQEILIHSKSEQPNHEKNIDTCIQTSVAAGIELSDEIDDQVEGTGNESESAVLHGALNSDDCTSLTIEAKCDMNIDEDVECKDEETVNSDEKPNDNAFSGPSFKIADETTEDSVADTNIDDTKVVDCINKTVDNKDSCHVSDTNADIVNNLTEESRTDIDTNIIQEMGYANDEVDTNEESGQENVVLQAAICAGVTAVAVTAGDDVIEAIENMTLNKTDKLNDINKTKVAVEEQEDTHEDKICLVIDNSVCSVPQHDLLEYNQQNEVPVIVQSTTKEKYESPEFAENNFTVSIRGELELKSFSPVNLNESIENNYTNENSDKQLDTIKPELECAIKQWHNQHIATSSSESFTSSEHHTCKDDTNDSSDSSDESSHDDIDNEAKEPNLHLPRVGKEVLILPDKYESESDSSGEEEPPALPDEGPPTLSPVDYGDKYVSDVTVSAKTEAYIFPPVLPALRLQPERSPKYEPVHKPEIANKYLDPVTVENDIEVSTHDLKTETEADLQIEYLKTEEDTDEFSKEISEFKHNVDLMKDTDILAEKKINVAAQSQSETVTIDTLTPEVDEQINEDKPGHDSVKLNDETDQIQTDSNIDLTARPLLAGDITLEWSASTQASKHKEMQEEPIGTENQIDNQSDANSEMSHAKTKEELKAERREKLRKLQYYTRPTRVKMDTENDEQTTNTDDTTATFKKKMQMWNRKSSSTDEPDKKEIEKDPRRISLSSPKPPDTPPSTPTVDTCSNLRKLRDSLPPGEPPAGSVADYIRKLSRGQSGGNIPNISPASEKIVTDKEGSVDIVMRRQRPSEARLRRPVSLPPSMPEKYINRRSEGKLASAIFSSKPFSDQNVSDVQLHKEVKPIEEKYQINGVTDETETIPPPRRFRNEISDERFIVEIKPIKDKHPKSADEENEEKSELQRRDSLKKSDPPKRKVSLSSSTPTIASTKPIDRIRNIWQAQEQEAENDAMLSPVQRKDSFEVKVRPVILKRSDADKLITDNAQENGIVHKNSFNSPSRVSVSIKPVTDLLDSEGMNIEHSSANNSSERPYYATVTDGKQPAIRTGKTSILSIVDNIANPATKTLKTIDSSDPTHISNTESSPLRKKIGQSERKYRSLSITELKSLSPEKKHSKPVPLTVITKSPGSKVLNYVQSCIKQQMNIKPQIRHEKTPLTGKSENKDSFVERDILNNNDKSLHADDIENPKMCDVNVSGDEIPVIKHEADLDNCKGLSKGDKESESKPIKVVTPSEVNNIEKIKDSSSSDDGEDVDNNVLFSPSSSSGGESSEDECDTSQTSISTSSAEIEEPKLKTHLKGIIRELEQEMAADIKPDKVPLTKDAISVDIPDSLPDRDSEQKPKVDTVQYTSIEHTAEAESKDEAEDLDTSIESVSESQLGQELDDLVLCAESLSNENIPEAVKMPVSEFDVETNVTNSQLDSSSCSIKYLQKDAESEVHKDVVKAVPVIIVTDPIEVEELNDLHDNIDGEMFVQMAAVDSSTDSSSDSENGDEQSAINQNENDSVIDEQRKKSSSFSSSDDNSKAKQKVENVISNINISDNTSTDTNNEQSVKINANMYGQNDVSNDGETETDTYVVCHAVPVAYVQNVHSEQNVSMSQFDDKEIADKYPVTAKNDADTLNEIATVEVTELKDAENRTSDSQQSTDSHLSTTDYKDNKTDNTFDIGTEIVVEPSLVVEANSDTHMQSVYHDLSGEVVNDELDMNSPQFEHYSRTRSVSSSSSSDSDDDVAKKSMNMEQQMASKSTSSDSELISTQAHSSSAVLDICGDKIICCDVDTVHVTNELDEPKTSDFITSEVGFVADVQNQLHIAMAEEGIDKRKSSSSSSSSSSSEDSESETMEINIKDRRVDGYSSQDISEKDVIPVVDMHKTQTDESEHQLKRSSSSSSSSSSSENDTAERQSSIDNIDAGMEQPIVTEHRDMMHSFEDTKIKIPPSTSFEDMEVPRSGSVPDYYEDDLLKSIIEDSQPFKAPLLEGAIVTDVDLDGNESIETAEQNKDNGIVEDLRMDKNNIVSDAPCFKYFETECPLVVPTEYSPNDVPLVINDELLEIPSNIFDATENEPEKTTQGILSPIEVQVFVLPDESIKTEENIFLQSVLDSTLTESNDTTGKESMDSGIEDINKIKSSDIYHKSCEHQAVPTIYIHGDDDATLNRSDRNDICKERGNAESMDIKEIDKENIVALKRTRDDGKNEPLSKEESDNETSDSASVSSTSSSSNSSDWKDGEIIEIHDRYNKHYVKGSNDEINEKDQLINRDSMKTDCFGLDKNNMGYIESLIDDKVAEAIESHFSDHKRNKKHSKSNATEPILSDKLSVCPKVNEGEAPNSDSGIVKLDSRIVCEIKSDEPRRNTEQSTEHGAVESLEDVKDAAESQPVIKFMIGRETDPSKSEVARLIQQSLEQDRRREEQRNLEQDRLQQLHDQFQPRDEILEHEHLRHVSESDSREDGDVELDDSSSEHDEVEGFTSEEQGGEATPASFPSGVDTDSVSSPDDPPEQPVVEVFELRESSGDDVSPDMESQALFLKLKEAQCKNAVTETELAKLKAKIIVLENTEAQKKQYERKCEEMAQRLRETERMLNNARKEINHYQDLLEGSQGQYIGLEKKMKGDFTALEKKYHKAKKFIKEFQQREKDFIAEQESLLQQQAEKDQQYNALVKSLKDRIFQLEHNLAEAQKAAGLPVLIPPQDGAHRSEVAITPMVAPTVRSAPPTVGSTGRVRSLECESISSESDMSSAGPLSPEIDIEGKMMDLSINMDKSFESVPQTAVLDTSASKSKGQLASQVTRRPPSSKPRSKSQDSEDSMDAATGEPRQEGSSSVGLETWIKHDSDSTVRKSDVKKHRAQHQAETDSAAPGADTLTPGADSLLTPPPPPIQSDTQSGTQADQIFDQERKDSESEDTGSTVSQSSYDPSKPNFRHMESEIPGFDTISVDTIETLESEASTGSLPSTRKSKSISFPKLLKFGGGGDRDKGGVVLVSSRSLNTGDNDGGVTLIAKRKTDNDFDGASTTSENSTGYMVGELDDETKKQVTYSMSAPPSTQEGQGVQNAAQTLPISQWTSDHVSQYLSAIDMGKYASLLSITGVQFVTMDGARLKALGVSNTKDRETLKKRIKELKLVLDKERKQAEKERKQQEKEQKAREKEQKKHAKKK